ncbi:MAG: hypothetical protein MUP28_02290 [Candidatus Aminicenantes bacterium]|nr:hypothetical protein [Candidatus Aminicenantes bacterium]
MLAHVVNKATTGTITPPAGWTIIGAQSNTASSRSALFYKFAVQADVDATTFTFTLGTSGRNRGEMAAWLGVNTTTPINAANQQINSAGTSVAVPIVTVTDGCTVLIIGSNASGGVATACSGTDPVCSIAYAVAYSTTYCALACFYGIKSGTDAIDAHSLSTFTSAVSSGHAVVLTPALPTYDLIPAEGNQTQGSDAPGLTQEHQLAAAEGYQTELSDTPALSQTHVLAAAEESQEQASDGAVLTQTYVLAADEGFQIQTSDVPVLEEEAGAIDLIPDEGVQLEISDMPALSQVHNLIIAEGAQNQASDSPALSQIHNLGAAEGIQIEGSDSPALIQTHVLTALEGVQLQVSDETMIDRIIVLMADEGHQEQISDAALLDLLILLAVQEGWQEQFSDSAILTIESGQEFVFPVIRSRRVRDVLRTGRNALKDIGER